MNNPQVNYAASIILMLTTWYRVWKAAPKIVRIFTAPIIPIGLWLWNFQIKKDFRQLGID